MVVKTKKTTRAKKAKKAKKAKTLASQKRAKKPVAKKSAAAKTVNRRKPGEKKPAKQSAKKPASKRVAKTPAEKTAWKISPAISQSVVDVDIWKKGDLTIEHLTVYRSGWIIVDQLPDLSGYNQDEGVNILEEFEFDEHELIDGSEGSSFFPKELPQEECERLMALSDAELVDEGWTIESAIRFSGPLVVEEV